MLTTTGDWTETLREYVQANRNQNTHRTYSSGQKQYLIFCQNNSRVAVPAKQETVAMYMQHRLANKKSRSTISADLSAIVDLHKKQGFTFDTKAYIIQQMSSSQVKESITFEKF